MKKILRWSFFVALVSAFVNCSLNVTGVYSHEQDNINSMMNLKADHTYSYLISVHGRPVIGYEGDWQYSKRTVKLEHSRRLKITADNGKVVGVQSQKVDSLSFGKLAFQAFAVDDDTTQLFGAKIKILAYEALLTEIPYVIDGGIDSLTLTFLDRDVTCYFNRGAVDNFYNFYIDFGFGKNYSILPAPPFKELTYRNGYLTSDTLEFRRQK